MTDLFDKLQKEKVQEVSELKVVKFVPTTYHDIEFEQLPTIGWYKKYNESLAGLRGRGYERHPRQSELFTLLADFFEGKLNPGRLAVVNNIRSSWWEWFSLAWERKGNLLIAYLDPEGLAWDETIKRYTKKDFHYTSEHHFDVADKKSPVGNPLSEFSDDFVYFHYGRKYDELPQEIKKVTSIWLPNDGAFFPLGHRSGNYVGFGYAGKASRGVRQKPV